MSLPFRIACYARSACCPVSLDRDTSRSCLLQGQTVMPDSNESFMDGEKGLGMAIPEEATAKLGPLPSLMGSNRTAHDEVGTSASTKSRVIRSAPVKTDWPTVRQN